MHRLLWPRRARGYRMQFHRWRTRKGKGNPSTWSGEASRHGIFQMRKHPREDDRPFRAPNAFRFLSIPHPFTHAFSSGKVEVVFQGFSLQVKKGRTIQTRVSNMKIAIIRFTTSSIDIHLIRELIHFHNSYHFHSTYFFSQHLTLRVLYIYIHTLESPCCHLAIIRILFSFSNSWPSSCPISLPDVGRCFH